MTRVVAFVVATFVGSSLFAQSAETTVDLPPHPALPSTEVPIEPEPEVADPDAAILAVEPTTDRSSNQIAERLAALETELQDFKDHLAALQDALTEIASGDFSGTILGAMPQSENLRRELGAAMQGRVNLVNTTGREVPIYINGVRWSAVVNESYVYAPIGRVSFQTDLSQPPAFKRDWQMLDGQMQLTYRITANNQ